MVLEGSIWHFDKHLMAIRVVMENDIRFEIVIDKSPFWIRVCNFPLNL